MTVDPAVALFEARGRERDLHVHHPVTLKLQVDPLAGGVRRQQDSDRRAIRRRLEFGLDAFPLVDLQTAVEQGDTLRFEPVADEEILQPPLRVSILREHDDPVVAPDPARLAGLGQPRQQRLGLGVGAMSFPLGPLEHAREQRLFFLRQRIDGACGRCQRVLRPLVERIVRIDIVFKPFELGSEPAFGHLFGRPMTPQRAHVLAQSESAWMIEAVRRLGQRRFR